MSQHMLQISEYFPDLIPIVYGRIDLNIDGASLFNMTLKRFQVLDRFGFQIFGLEMFLWQKSMQIFQNPENFKI
jgi:hypothetical protein